MHRVGWQQAAAQASLLIAVGLSGCGRPLGTLEGAVTFEGQPVTAGHLMLFPTDGNYRHSSSVRITAGRYRITGIVPGERKVVLEHLGCSRTAESGAPQDGGGLPDCTGSYPETINVTAGRQTFDFALRRPAAKRAADAGTKDVPGMKKRTEGKL